MSDGDGQPGGLAGSSTRCLPGEPDNAFARYSNYGPVIDIAAPGTCVLTTASGGICAAPIGTSFSAPLVAGAVALIKARQPDATPKQVQAILNDTTDYAPPGDPDGIAEGLFDVSTL